MSNRDFIAREVQVERLVNPEPTTPINVGSIQLYENTNTFTDDKQIPDINEVKRLIATEPGGGGGTLDSVSFDNDDVDPIDNNIAYTLPSGIVILGCRIDQVVGGIANVKNLNTTYENGVIYGFEKLTPPDTQTIKVILSSTSAPTPTTAELTVVVNGLPGGMEITVGGEVWTDNKKTFPIGTVLTGFTPTAEGYTFDPLSIATITMDEDKTVTFDAIPDVLPTLAETTVSVGTETETTIPLTWTAVTNATNYTVDRATNVGFTTGVSLAIYSGSGLAFTNTGLTASTTYYYRVNTTASGYTGSTSDVVSGTTEAAIPSGIIPEAFFTGGGGSFSYNNTTGVLSGVGANVTSVAANTSDTAPNSSLDIRSIEIGWSSNWPTKDIVFGLSQENYGASFGDINLAVYIPSSGNVMIRKAKTTGGGGGTDVSTGYNLGASSPTTDFKLKVEAVAGATFWEVYFYRSEDDGDNWISLTGLTAITAIPIATNLYGQVNVLGANTTINGIKVTV